VDDLIKEGHVDVAYELWRCLIGSDSESAEDAAAISNGGFENDILVGFSQFDWSIQESKYATVSIDTATVHSGKRSLRIDFLGHETTRLENEVQQLVPLHAGAHYRVQYSVKTANLDTPGGPRITIRRRNSN